MSGLTNRQKGVLKGRRTRWARDDVMRYHGRIADMIERLETMPDDELREDQRLVNAVKHLKKAERCLFVFYCNIRKIDPPT